ncbi:MAG: hypothetical protein WDO24_16470 [Pseudomonadota bacterium]
MAYTALFQGHPVRFTEPSKGTSSCALELTDVVHVLQAAGVDPAVLAASPGQASSGQIGFAALIHWLEDIRASGTGEISMFLHWLLRHMPNAQVALGLPLLGYLQGGAAPRQAKRRAA